MPSFKIWDIVKVPFPYTDRPIRERRPALVICAGNIEERHGLLWLLMITSAANRAWPNDVQVSEIPQAGLPVASIVRCAKIATIDARDAERIGTLPEVDRPHVRQIHALLPIVSSTRSKTKAR